MRFNACVHHAKAKKILVQLGEQTRLTNTCEELSALQSQTTLILANFIFRMASNKSLNAACNLDGYLFCKMPAGALVIEVKVKTT